MDRKEFLKKGASSIVGIVAAPSILTSCAPPMDTTPWDGSGPCPVSPRETEGPFSTHSPAELVRENIVADRSGIPLMITLTIRNSKTDCSPYAGAIVDLWHCDADGNYSEYGGAGMQPTDYKAVHFLRGRQTTNQSGQVGFISIFPGWYRDRAPHIHAEIFDAGGTSLLVTQIAFSKETCDRVYAAAGYHGPAATLNEKDNVFSNSLAGNMADSLTGDMTNGYALSKAINV
ncbi:MAG: intradiol ring-cleavage dioxygenase [Pyrinomonadaceae bacterium]